MNKNFEPKFLEVEIGTSAESTAITARYIGAWATAYIENDSPNILNLEEVYVPESIRRRGIGTMLVRTEITASLEYTNGRINQFTMAIINPFEIDILNKVSFGSAFFYDIPDYINNIRSVLSVDDAKKLVVQRQKIFKTYNKLGIDPPKQFDAGIYAKFGLQKESLLAS